MKKNIYLNQIKELKNKSRKGYNTRIGVPRHHIYKVDIGDYTYFKFQIKRDGVSHTVYFKKKKEAVTFRKAVAKTGSLRTVISRFKKKNSLSYI
jgi:hypothetical protein